MKRICKNKHWEITKNYNIDKILYLLVDRPTRINFANDFIWKNEVGEWHRDYDLPANIYADGFVTFKTNNKFHRTVNKPAKIWNDGYQEYFVNGNFIIK